MGIRPPSAALVLQRLDQLVNFDKGILSAILFSKVAKKTLGHFVCLNLCEGSGGPYLIRCSGQHGRLGHNLLSRSNYASPKKEGRGWAPRYTLSFHTSIIMAYGYYQQSGMPGWGTNQATLVNCVPLFRLTFSFSFGSELHLLQVFSPNPPVSPGYEGYQPFLVVTHNTGGGTDFYRAHALTSDPSVPMVTFISIVTYE